MVKTKEFKIDVKTYVKASLNESKKSIMCWLLMTGLFSIYVGYISVDDYIYNGSFDVMLSWMPFFLIMLLFIAFLFLFIPVWVYKNESNKTMFSSRTLTFLDSAFECQTIEGSNTFIPYNTLVKVGYSENYIALWTSSMFFFLVPLDVFTSDSDIQEVKIMLDKIT